MSTLSVEEKVQKAIELSKQGLTRQEIADILYTSSDNKTRLGGLRKLMKRWGYIWSELNNEYVAEQETVAQLEVTATTVHNEQPVEEPVEPPTDVLTQKDIMELKELLTLIKGTAGGLTGVLSGTGTILSESPISFTEFTGEVQGTTMQLHEEVWTALDAFCKQTKFSKKLIINEAIWDFLKKQGAVDSI